MATLTQSYKGMTVLVNLNLDRILTTGTVVGALYAGSYFALLGVS